MSDDPRIEIRAASAAPTVEDGSGRPRIAGHFARFNTFNEIDSAVEGRFLERIEPGAFARTLKNNRDRIRMLFQHGRDPQIGDKPIGTPEVLREDKVGPYFEGDLFDSVPDLIVDGLRAGQYGISYRFSVINEDWNRPTTRTDYNPQMLPERTIREAKVFEFGPVTFPADPGADYAVRAINLTDLDAAPAPPEEAPALPDGPEAEVPHSDEGTREEPIPVEPPKEKKVEKFTNLEDMKARVRELNEEIKRAAELPGVLPEKEQAEFDAKVAERSEVEHAITAWQARLSQVRDGAEDDTKVERPYSPQAVIVRKTESDIYDIPAIIRTSNTEEQRDQKLRDNALRSIETFNGLPDYGRERATFLVDNKDSANKELARRILNTGSPQYRRAWNAYVTNGERGTALAVGVDGTGGYAVPYAYDLSVTGTGQHTWINPFRAACRVETIVGTDTWRGLTANAVTAAFGAEADPATEQGPTFTQPEIIVKKAFAFVTYSIEMGQDRPDLGQELAVLMGEAKDNLEENQFAVGTGATVYPHGMMSPHATLLYTHIDASTAHALVIADIDATEAALPLRHRKNAAWFMNKKIFRTIQGLETTGGRLFGGDGYPGVAANGNNPTGTLRPILGYPTYEVPSAPSDLTVDDYWILWFGDPKSFVIVDRVGMSVEYIPTIFGAAQGNLPTGQRGLYCYWRTNSDTVNADAGRLLKVLNA